MGTGQLGRRSQASRGVRWPEPHPSHQHSRQRQHRRDFVRCQHVGVQRRHHERRQVEQDAGGDHLIDPVRRCPARPTERSAQRPASSGRCRAGGATPRPRSSQPRSSGKWHPNSTATDAPVSPQMSEELKWERRATSIRLPLSRRWPPICKRPRSRSRRSSPRFTPRVSTDGRYAAPGKRAAIADSPRRRRPGRSAVSRVLRATPAPLPYP